MTRWVVAAACVWVLVVVAAWVVHTQGGPPLCQVRRVTGVPCPTCGSTRAAIALATGRPLDAVRLNPLMSVFMVVAPLYFAWRFTFGQRVAGLSSRAWTRVVWVSLGLLVLNWAYVLWMERHPLGQTP